MTRICLHPTTCFVVELRQPYPKSQQQTSPGGVRLLQLQSVAAGVFQTAHA